MRLIVGLGNPVEEYERTRHNVGIRVVRILGRIFSEHHEAFGDWKNDAKIKAMYAKGKIGGKGVILLYPLTYMNESGGPVQRAARFWKIPASDILVIFDDKDLPLGTIRIRKGGTSGGHNGMRSVMEALGTEDVPRMRIGVGSEISMARKTPAADFVLGKFSKEEEKTIAQTMDRAAKAVELAIRQDIDAAMNAFNE